MELGDGEQGDRLDAGQVGYGEGQAGHEAGSPRTTGEATPGIGDRKASISTAASHTTTTREETVPLITDT